jgi:NodT family efflux transporter outer membrane factor (OMF) lipoprotein
MIRSSLAIATLLVACSPHKVTENPEAPLALPGAFSSGGERPLPDRWWEDFGDSELDRLIDETLAGNFELKAAWARLKQADALARQAGAGRYPLLDLTASANRAKFFNRFVPPGTGAPSTIELTTYSASVAANYEIDVFLKMTNQARGATRDAYAARDQVESVAMSLAAQVTETWFDLAHQRAQRALITRQVELNQTLLELVTLRFEGGLGSAVEVLQQKQQLIATRSQLAQINAAEAVLKGQLAVLSGRPPGGGPIPAASQLPALPALPGTGIPADLLNRRPDVRAARNRVAAADYRVAVAVADRFPALRIGATLDFQETSLVDLFKTPLWTLFASITAPLFDGFRRSAEVSRQKAVVEELLSSYGDVLLRAIAEVERALVEEREQLALIVDLEEVVTVAGDNLREARLRYQQGVSQTGFLTVLQALQSQQSAELNLLSARRRLLSFRVQLCRALGGTWTRSLTPTNEKK